MTTRRTVVRAGLCLLALVELVLGAWTLLFPEGVTRPGSPRRDLRAVGE